MLSDQIKAEIQKLEGPIVVFGAGGFIGSNLFRYILEYRDDVYGITSKEPFIPWRIDDLRTDRIIHANLTEIDGLQNLFQRHQFKTIFDLAAYGAYAKQNDVKLIYRTNVIGLLNLLQVSSAYNIKAFVHAGSSSEYGLNCKEPLENAELLPNSHYAVTKASAANMIKYYGTILEFPIVNLRYYSIYGEYEEPDRLIPQIIEKGIKKEYPPLVQPDISRDFVYIDDAIYATLLAANADFSIIGGQSINIASNKKTTIRDIAKTAKEIFDIPGEPVWGDFPNRKWDLKEWYGNASLAKKILNWEATTGLKEGLTKTYHWQKKYSRPLYEKKLYQDQVKYKISAVIACYKDAQAMLIMYERLVKTFHKINANYEIIFVNDASPDNTSEILQMLVQQNKYVTGIEHSRNFGSQSAFLSGMEIATGDAVVLLDGDLQDPPELIENFYAKWQEGYDVVYGRRVKREGNLVLVKLYKVFYRVFRNLSYVPMPLDAGDFSMMDRKVVDELIKLPETDQFLRGLRAWVGFKQVGVPYTRPERMFGVTTNNWRKNIGWARKAIFSFSYVPLELLSYLGWALTLVSLLAAIVQIVLFFTGSPIPHGITTIIVLILFFGGMTMLAISILGEYQAKILEEVKKRPKFIRRRIIKSQQDAEE
ncbi:MAG TPA: NAD-dependent epimerase/dehydratase family protein [Chitinophagaceae bacterium]|jgi:nucleoside-diphosphate-sugar epimerase/glycosyltransferase involved in cell wall biosynthesis|nr:NAD-dependent epimerase/dehydratase family protein [Chitinophagaceae bacterium]